MKLTTLALVMIAMAANLAMGVDDPQIVPAKNSNSPFVTFRIWIHAGSAHDPAGKEGLAALTASLIGNGGTKANRYEDILRKLFPMAASYSVQVDREMTVLVGTCHKDHLPAFYSLVKDALLSPGFSDDDFNRLKTDQANYLETTLRYSSDEDLGKALLHAVAFEGTSYAHPEDGLVETVKTLTLDDVKGFYQKFYTRSNITIGIAGGFGEDFVESVRRDFQSLPQGSPAPSAAPAAAQKAQGLRVFIVEKETRATAISFGHPSDFTRADDDFYPMMIANSWLGEHRNSASHLYQVMRETRGLNYGDYSYIEWFPMGSRYSMPYPNVARHRQMFEVWIRPVVNSNRHFALREAVRELRALHENGMTKESLELTRNFLLNYCLNYAPTESYRLGFRLDDLFYGLTEGHLDRIQQRVKAATLEQVNAAVKKHLDPANMDVVIITQDAEALKKALIENASSPIHYDSPTPESVLAEDKLIQDYKLDIKPENIHILPVKEVFAK